MSIGSAIIPGYLGMRLQCVVARGSTHPAVFKNRIYRVSWKCVAR